MARRRKREVIFARALCIGLSLSASGCLLAGNYHSAKTLNPGESSFGLTFSATNYELNEFDEVDGEETSASVTIPNIIPEITYHVGLQENVEVGGRIGIGALAAEIDLKYRFLQTPNLHLAIAPAIGAQSLIIINGFTAKLPVIATMELSDNVAITGAVFAATTRYSSPNLDDGDEDLAIFGGNLGNVGASFGIEFSGATLMFRPAVEFTRYQFDFDDDDNFDSFTTVNFLVHMAFIGGREKLQLDRIENKIDRMGGG